MSPFAPLCAADFRDLARTRLSEAGFRGFVRAAPAGGELLVTDVCRYAGKAASACGAQPAGVCRRGTKAPSAPATVYAARPVGKPGADAARERLVSAGFVLREERGLLFFSPGEAWLDRLAEDWEKSPLPADGWDGLTPARALAARLLRRRRAAERTAAGRQLLLEALRLPPPAPEGWPAADALRPEIARMLGRGDASGMRETGALLSARLARLSCQPGAMA